MTSSPLKVFVAPFILPVTSPIISDGAIVMDAEKIVAVGPRFEILRDYPEVTVEEMSQVVLMPGLINAHTHLDLIFHEASGETPQFFPWLISGWEFRKTQTLSDKRHALEEGIRQLARSGATTVGDAGSFIGLIPQALNAPIRMVLFPEILHGGEASISEEYEGVFSQVEEILGAQSTRVTGGIAPYAAYTLSRHLLKIVSQQAAALKIPLKIHVAETFQEMQFFYESTGEIAETLFPRMGWKDMLPPSHRKTPIQYLDSIGFLDQAPTLVGCNHLSDSDLTLLAKRNCTIIHSPRSNAHLKVGNPPLSKLRSLGIPVALGTNGTASLHSLSLWDEMRYVRDHYPEGDRPDDWELLKMATCHAARALGLASKVGSLEAGKEADLIAVHIPKNATPHNLPTQLISKTEERDILAVFVQGKRLKH